MPKLTTDERFKRVMKFLIASNEPKIAGLLALRGYTAEDRKEGWDLLDRATGRHVDALPGAGTFSTSYRTVLEALDDWENIWFDVAEAALGRKYPEVSDRLFQNLSKVSGAEVVLTVKTFVGRVEEIRKAGDEQTQGAAALLEQRGLNQERLDEAAALLQKLEDEQGEVEVPVDDAEAKAEREAAIADMWAWFKDWSVTARTVIKNRNYHVMLGLVPHHGSSTEDKDAPPEAED